MIELVVLGTLAFVALMLVGVLASGLSMIFWFVFLPFRIVGWALKGIGLLLALPFLLLFGFVGVLIFGFGALVHREELPAFDIHQRSGHNQELARDFEIEQAHRIYVFDKLLGQTRQIDLVNVHFLLFNQIKEQIERAFKDLEFYLIFSHANRRIGRPRNR